MGMNWFGKAQQLYNKNEKKDKKKESTSKAPYVQQETKSDTLPVSLPQPTTFKNQPKNNTTENTVKEDKKKVDEAKKSNNFKLAQNLLTGEQIPGSIGFPANRVKDARVFSDYSPSIGLSKEEYEKKRVSDRTLPAFGSYDYFKNKEKEVGKLLDDANREYFYLSGDWHYGLIEQAEKNPEKIKEYGLEGEVEKIKNAKEKQNSIRDEYKEIVGYLEKFKTKGVNKNNQGEVDVSSGKKEAEEEEKVYNRLAVSFAPQSLEQITAVKNKEGSLEDVKTGKDFIKSRSKKEVAEDKYQAYEDFEKERDNTYGNNPVGVLTGNAKLGRLDTKRNDTGYTIYKSKFDDTEAADVYEELIKTIQKNSPKTFDNSSNIKEALAGIGRYIPQFVDQTKEQIKGYVIGSIAGYALGGGTGALVKDGARVGGSAYSARYMFKQTAGGTYLNLLKESDISTEEANRLAKNTAIASAAIEFGLEFATTRLFSKGKDIVKKVTGSGVEVAEKELVSTLTKNGVNNATQDKFKEVAKKFGKVFLNSLGEGLEEGSQTIIEKGAERIAKEGKNTGMLNLLWESIQVDKLSEDDWREVGESAAAGMLLGIVSSGIKSGAFNTSKAIGKTTGKIVNTIVNTINDNNIGKMILSDKTGSLVDEYVLLGLGSDNNIAKEIAEEIEVVAYDQEKGSYDLNKVDTKKIGKLAKIITNEISANSETESVSDSNVASENDAVVDNTQPESKEAVVGKEEPAEVETGIVNATEVVSEGAKEQQAENTPAVSVGDEFKDTKYGNTITIIDRNDVNTTVEINTGTKTEQKVVTNEQADTLVSRNQYEKVKTEGTTSPEESQRYNIIVSNLKRKAEELGLLDTNFFNTLQNVNLYNLSANDKTLISREFQRVFAGNTDPLVTSWLDSISVDDQSAPSVTEDAESVIKKADSITETPENEKITVGMSDDARAELLNKKSVNVVSFDAEHAKTLENVDIEALQNSYAGYAGPIIRQIARDFGILNTPLYNADIELEFNYSGDSVRESINKQHSRYGDFVKMLSVFPDVVKNAVGVETHPDKYEGTTREDKTLKQMYVLTSAFSDGTEIHPVKLEVKEFKDYKNNKNKLYLSVVLTKKGSQHLGGNLGQDQTKTTPLTSTISIADLVGIVNPSEGDFLKYFPDSMLDSEQIEGKNEALAKDAEKIEKLSEDKKRSLATAENADALSSTPETTNSTAPADIVPQDNDIVNSSVRNDTENDTKSLVLSSVKNRMKPEISSNVRLMDMLSDKFGGDGINGLVNEIVSRYNRDKSIGDFESLFTDNGEEIYNSLESDVTETKNYSLSSMGAAFFDNENITANEFREMLRDGSYKEFPEYQKYIADIINVYRQSSGLKSVSDKDISEIERQIEGIINVAIASAEAGYNITDRGEERTVTDSKNRLLFSSLEPNSDYVTSSDISAICDKRKNFAEIYDEIVALEESRNVPVNQRFFNNVDNYFVLHKLMADKGLTIPCEECYVESMRKNLAPMAKAFIELVTENNPNNKKNEQLYNKDGQIKKNNQKLRDKVRKLYSENGTEVVSGKSKITVDSLTPKLLTTADGLVELKLQSPLLYEAFNSFYGQSKPKMPRTATPFRPGELIALLTDKYGNIKKGLVDKIKSSGGFRLQSYSDFQIENFVDVLQTIFEASMLGLNGHAYTKVPAFLDATDGTNLKRNVSIFMYNDNGDWKLDKKNSFPMELEDIYALVENDTTGNTSIIAVSQNADMSSWIMANDKIDFGIPFHKSGLKMDVVRSRTVKTEDGREILGYANQKDHTAQQSEVYKRTLGEKKKENTKVSNPINIYKEGFWDFDNKENLSKKKLIEKNIKAYIDECNKREYRPKFREYVMNNESVLESVLRYAKDFGTVPKDATIDDISFKYGEYTIPYGYYKFLGDFGMFKMDGSASPIELLSLENYDFDKAVAYFENKSELYQKELLRQLENGSVRERYQKMIEDGTLTTEQLNDIIKEKRKEIANDIVIGKNASLMEEDFDERREDLLSGNSGRRNNESTRKQAERLSAFERENQGRTREERKQYTDELVSKGQTEEIIDGNDKYTLVNPDAYNDDMRSMVEYAAKEGIELGFFVGNATVKFDSKRAFKVNGIKMSSKKILIQYDSILPPQKLLMHELVHINRDNPIVQKMINSLSEEDKKRIFSQNRYKRYFKLYNGDVNAVLEEFVADVMSGMNDYTADYIDIVTDYWYDGKDIDKYNPAEYNKLIDTGSSDGNNESVNPVYQPIKQRFKSAGTSLNQVAALFKNKHFHPGKVNIDIGGGKFDATSNFLRSLGTENYVFDPFNRTEQENTATLEYLMSGKKADTATCANVLNVIDTEAARLNVILETAKAIKSDGTAYFTVYTSDNSGVGRQTQADSWQNARKTEDYVSEIETYFNNVERKGNIIIAKEPKTNLPQASWEVKPGKAVRYALSTQDNDTEFWNEWIDLAKEYGVIPKGENPVRDVNVPQKISDDQVVSRFARTMMEAEVTPDDNISDFEKAILNGEMTHVVITNKDALNWARRQIEYLGFEGAMNKWSVLSDSGKIGKNEIVLGMELYNQCITNKDVRNAMKIAAELAAEETRAGQILQAARLLKLMSPDGQLYYLEKSIQKMNDEFREKLGEKYKDIELDEELIKEFLEEKDQAKRDIVYDKICQNIADQIPATMLDKWNSWRYLVMLGNPRTHIRNIIGNAVFIPSVRLKNYVAAVIEQSLKIDPSERKASLYKRKDAIEFAKTDFEAMKKTLQGENAKYAVTSDIEGKRTIFKTKWLEMLRLKNFDFLEKEDMWFLKMHYVDALARLITVRNIDVNSISQQTLDSLRAFAVKEAQEATYRDANSIADGLTRLQRNLERSKNKAVRSTSYLIEGVMPFKKTPMNIAKQGVNYSPIGLIKGLYKSLKKLNNGDITTAELIDDFAKGLTGTGVALLGLWLASLGVIVGSGDKPKKEKEFEKMVGEQSYAIKVKDMFTYTIDWMTPSNLSLFIGAKLYELTKDEFSFSDIVEALTTVTEPLLELSVFSGLNGVIESAQYSDSEALYAIGADMITSYLMQALPTIGGQLSRILDENKREYYYIDKNRNIPKGLQNLIGQASSKIPFASYLFEPAIDEWGREEKYGNAIERVLENTVSPGYYAEDNYTEVDKELKELYDKTGESSVLPVTQQKFYKQNGIYYHMSAKDYTEVKKIRGQKSFELVSNLLNDDMEVKVQNKQTKKYHEKRYSQMTDEEKVDAIKKCYEDAGAYAKDKMFEKIKKNSEQK